MARGTGAIFNQAISYIRDGDVDMDAGTWRMILCEESIVSLTIAETNPALGSTNITEVANGGGYATGGIALTLDNSESGGVLTVKLNTTTHTGGVLAWSKAGSSPTNIKSAVLYDDAATTPANAAVAFWDVTEDGGTTAVSLQAVDIDLITGDGATAGDLFTMKTVA